MFLFGTYSQDLGFVDGKGSGVCDDDGNVLIPKSVVTNSSYLTRADNNTLYVVDELGSGGRVHAFDAKTFELLSSGECAGADSCYVTATPRHVFVANYAGNGSGGSVARFSRDLRNRTVVELGTGEYPGLVPSRQEASHAHIVLPLRDESAVLVTDLGSDVLWRVELSGDEGLRGPATVACRVNSGSGPRHAAFHPDLPLLYVLNELACTIDAFATDSVGSPQKTRVATYYVGGGSKKEGDTAAALRVTKKALFCSIRVDEGEEGVIRCFRLDQSSGLPSSLPLSIGSRGLVPRDFVIADNETKLVVANQNSDNLVTFDLDPTSGLPSIDASPTVKNLTAAKTPVCILEM